MVQRLARHVFELTELAVHATLMHHFCKRSIRMSSNTEIKQFKQPLLGGDLESRPYNRQGKLWRRAAIVLATTSLLIGGGFGIMYASGVVPSDVMGTSVPISRGSALSDKVFGTEPSMNVQPAGRSAHELWLSRKAFIAPASMSAPETSEKSKADAKVELKGHEEKQKHIDAMIQEAKEQPAPKREATEWREDPLGLIKKLIADAPQGARVQVETCDITPGLNGHGMMKCCHSGLGDQPGQIVTCHMDDSDMIVDHLAETARSGPSSLFGGLFDKLFSDLGSGMPAINNLGGHFAIVDGTDAPINFGDIELAPGLNYFLKGSPQADVQVEGLPMELMASSEPMMFDIAIPCDDSEASANADGPGLNFGKGFLKMFADMLEGPLHLPFGQ